MDVNQPVVNSISHNVLFTNCQPRDQLEGNTRRVEAYFVIILHSIVACANRLGEHSISSCDRPRAQGVRILLLVINANAYVSS